MREGIAEWLEYSEVKAEGGSKLESYLAQREAEGKQKPKMPTPLIEARRLRRFNFTHLMYSGGMSNQPYIWHREIHTALDAEDEYMAIKKATQRMKAEKSKTQ